MMSQPGDSKGLHYSLCEQFSPQRAYLWVNLSLIMSISLWCSVGVESIKMCPFLTSKCSTANCFLFISTAKNNHCYHHYLPHVPLGSPSHSGDVVVYIFDVNQPSLPAPFHSVLVSISVFMALSTVFHSINSSNNSPLSHSVLPVFFSA